MCFAGEGTSTSSFLKIGIGARPIGMGEAFVAVCDDVSSIYWNPAGLGQIEFKEVSVMQNKWVEGINYQFFGYSMPIRRAKTEKKLKAKTPAEKKNVTTEYGLKLTHYGSIGISASYLSMGDIQGYYGQEALDSQIGKPSKLLSASDMAGIISYGRQVTGSQVTPRSERLFVGGSIKLISKTLAYKSAQGFAADVGCLYKPAMTKGKLSFGLNVQNIGTGLMFEAETSPFPLNVKVGTAYKWDLYGNDLICALDYNHVTNSVSLGSEYVFWDLISLRLGYKVSQHLDNGVRGGIGIGSRYIRFDYAYTPFGVLGDTHRISMNFKFGKKPTTVEMVEDTIKQHYRRGQRYYQRDNFVMAYQEFKTVVFLDREHKEALKKLGEIEVSFKDFKTKLAEEKRRMEIERNIKRGEELFNKGDYVSAGEVFNTVLSLQPDNKVAREYVEKIDKAYQQWTKQEIKKLSTEGEALFNEGKYAESIEKWGRILEIDPLDADAYNWTKKSNEKIKELDKKRREEDERRAKEREKQRIKDLYNKSVNLYNTGRWEQAIDGFKEVLKSEPANAEAKSYLDKSLAGLKKQKEENARKSQEIYTEGLKEYTVGNLKKAISLWEKAVKLDPENVKAVKSLERAREEIKKK